MLRTGDNGETRSGDFSLRTEELNNDDDVGDDDDVYASVYEVVYVIN